MGGLAGCSVGTRDQWRESPAPEDEPPEEIEYPPDAEYYEGRLLPSHDACPTFQVADEHTHLLTNIPDRYLPIKDFVQDHFWIVCVENNFRNGLCGGERSLRVIDMGLLFLKEGS